MFRLLLNCARALAPWRVVASYGVFYPHSSPPLKWALVFEGSSDGETWKPYPYRYSPTGPRSAPPFVAPWHPRLDHDVFYKALGMNNANFSSNIGTAHPYTLANVTPSQLLCARLVEDDSRVRDLFRDPPFPAGAPPRYARASLRLLVPRASALRGENGMLDTEDGARRVPTPPPPPSPTLPLLGRPLPCSLAATVNVQCPHSHRRRRCRRRQQGRPPPRGAHCRGSGGRGRLVAGLGRWRAQRARGAGRGS